MSRSSNSAQALRRRVVARWRAEGSRGQTISRHRALIRHDFPYQRLAGVLLPPTVLSLLLVWAQPLIVGFWSRIMHWAIDFTGVAASVMLTSSVSGVPLGVHLIWLEMDAGAPSPWQWWGAAALAFGLALASLRLPSRMLPIAYVARIYAVVIVVSLAFFAVVPARFTYSLADHVAMLLLMMLLLAAVAPWVLSLTYNILDFRARDKVLLSLMAVVFLVVTAPLQAFSHALVLHYGSLLYQPMLFLLLGIFPPLVGLVGLYSWAMTWPRAVQRVEGA